MKITAKYLTQVYRDGTYGLDDFSVEISGGDFVTVLGESGSGKTTLLRVLAGLEKCACGELYLNGVLSKDIPLKSRKTSMVFQEYVLYPKFTVWENIRTALERYDLDEKEESARIKKVLKDFGLTEIAGQLPRDISGGQQQRVALAKAVVTNPELLLFDEPLSNVAEDMRANYMQLLLKLKSDLPKTTFVYVTHNVKEALTLGNKLLIMCGGKAVQFGDTKFVLNNPYSAEVVKTLFGTQEGVDEEGKPFIFNPSTKKKIPLDTKGRALSGQPEYLTFDGSFDGNTLTFGGVSMTVDEDFPYRYLGGGKITVGVASEKVTAQPFDGCVEIAAEQCGYDEFIIAGAKFTLKNIAGFGGKLYFSADAVTCFENGVRALAHYRAYTAECRGRIIGNKLILPCGKVPFKGKNGSVIVAVKPCTRATLDKKAGFRFQCLAEEDFGKYRLAYCKLDGFDRYLTLKTGKTLGGKQKITPDLFEISVRYE